MKNEKNILVAFILNLTFSLIEFLGGFFTGSVAIISDAVHDIGDAASIGISYFLERKSHRAPDRDYTYGYARFSVLGGLITTLILIVGSVMVVINAVEKIINPTDIRYDGMIILAILGVVVNLGAALVTRSGETINQRAVNLHMLEDVLGWLVVLIGAVVMRFTDFKIIDPLMSIGVAVFIFINAIGGLKEVLDLFLEKTPQGIGVDDVSEKLLEIEGVLDVHHIHIRSIDGQVNHATMHIVTNTDAHEIKHKVRHELCELGITHTTLELETEDEHCGEKSCSVNTEKTHSHHHHHHHNH